MQKLKKVVKKTVQANTDEQKKIGAKMTLGAKIMLRKKVILRLKSRRAKVTYRSKESTVIK